MEWFGSVSIWYGSGSSDPFLLRIRPNIDRISTFLYRVLITQKIIHYYLNVKDINSSEKHFLITIFYVFKVKNNQVFVICYFLRLLAVFFYKRGVVGAVPDDRRPR